MPIFPVFDSAVFGPAQIKMMGDALDRAIRLFETPPPKIVREVIANRIIEAVRQGVRDVDQLVEAGLVGTGLKG
jgi:hypothetical protein